MLVASEAQRARFQQELERGSKLPRGLKESKKDSSTKGLKRSSSLSRGKTQEVKPERRGFWHGILATKLRLQEQEDGFDGFYRCRCGMPECHAEIEGFEEAFRFYVPGHVKPRASFNHKGYRFGYLASLGPDDPDNIVPVTSECNRAEFWRRSA